MSTFVWTSEDGWPYPDTAAEWADPEPATDDDLLSVRFDAHLLEALDPLERHVLASRFGLDGRTAQSLAELHDDLGMSAEDVEMLLTSGLTKLRARLT